MSALRALPRDGRPDQRTTSGPAAQSLHQQAEHKTVPDQSFARSPCQSSAVHTRLGSVGLTAPEQLIALLRSKGGSDVQALSDALGWQPHTVRAALTGLRKAGVALEKMAVREGERTRYRINVKRGRSAQ